MHLDMLAVQLLAHPWRPVDARYRLAVETLRQGRVASFRHGAAVVELAKFLRRLALCQTGSDERQLLIDMPTTYLAVELHESASYAERSTLEARLLAGEAPEIIGRKMNLRPSAIVRYAEFFFDVMDRRECLDFVVQTVIGRVDRSSSDDRVHAALMKTVAYFGGADALDAYLYPGQGSDRSALTRAAEVVGLWAHNRVQEKAVLALERLQAGDPASTRELLKSIGVRESTHASEQTSTVERHVAAMLAELPWTTGRQAQEVLPAELAGLDNEAAELHDDELMLLAAGQRCPEAEAEIRELSSRVPSSERSRTRTTP